MLGWFQADFEDDEQGRVGCEIHDPVSGRFEARLVGFRHVHQGRHAEVGFEQIALEVFLGQEKRTGGLIAHGFKAVVLLLHRRRRTPVPGLQFKTLEEVVVEELWCTLGSFIEVDDDGLSDVGQAVYDEACRRRDKEIEAAADGARSATGDPTVFT